MGSSRPFVLVAILMIASIGFTGLATADSKHPDAFCNNQVGTFAKTGIETRRLSIVADKVELAFDLHCAEASHEVQSDIQTLLDVLNHLEEAGYGGLGEPESQESSSGDPIEDLLRALQGEVPEHDVCPLAQGAGTVDAYVTVEGQRFPLNHQPAVGTYQHAGELDELKFRVQLLEFI